MTIDLSEFSPAYPVVADKAETRTDLVRFGQEIRLPRRPGFYRNFLKRAFDIAAITLHSLRSVARRKNYSTDRLGS